MAKFQYLTEGTSLENLEEDFRDAVKVEQYRLGRQALYIPAGFRWSVLPFSAIRAAEESHRSVSAGKCVSVTERRPELLIKTDAEEIKLPLERPASLQTLLDALEHRA